MTINRPIKVDCEPLFVERCIHCGRAIKELPGMKFIHIESDGVLCLNGSGHLACPPNMGSE